MKPLVHLIAFVPIIPLWKIAAFLLGFKGMWHLFGLAVGLGIMLYTVKCTRHLLDAVNANG